MGKKGIISLFTLLFLALLLTGCKPSDKYAGDWYAITNQGEEVQINFSKEKKMTILKESGEEEIVEINQTGTGFQNNIGYYKVDIDNVSYYVIFEDREDESNAILIRQTNMASDFEDVVGQIVYVMNRESYPVLLR